MTTSIIEVATQAYQDQKPGTSGLRKKVTVFQQPNYLENFIQAIYEAVNKPRILVVGGDGRFFMLEAIERIINVLVANKIDRIIVPKNGLLSTPAASALIRRVNAQGGIILTASHNPGGPDGDFGVKYNNNEGAPAPEYVTDKIYEISKRTTSYKSLIKKPKIDLTRYFVYNVNDTKVTVIDPVLNYSEVISQSFNFTAIERSIGAGNMKVLVDCMNGVMGPYADHIFKEKLPRLHSQLINNTPLPDFGGKHPDPNLTYAKDLVERMTSDPTIQFGIAFDGDGDRNMVLGQGGFFVSPGDALAIIVNNYDCIPQKKVNFNGTIGVARSFPTAPAVDRVVAKKGGLMFETPTGWKFFGELLGREVDVCGEESFGLGSSHIREKDGMWACLAWLSVLAQKKCGVKQLVEDHWKEFGRDYFNRYDFEDYDLVKCQAMMKELETLLTGRSLIGKKFASYEVSETGDFAYKGPNLKVTPGQGLYVKFTNDARIIVRLSGTGSSGATVRIYLNAYEKDNIELDNTTYLKELLTICYEITKLPEYLGTDQPTVIT